MKKDMMTYILPTYYPATPAVRGRKTDSSFVAYEDGLAACPDTQGKCYLPRQVWLIVVHCTATRPDQELSPEALIKMHRKRGFRTAGYHLYVTRDGRLNQMRPLYEVGAHCRGFNLHSIGIAYEGGLDSYGNPADTRTPLQKKTLLETINLLKELYPGVRVMGHYQVSPNVHKACPCFDAMSEYDDVVRLKQTPHHSNT